MPRLRQNFLTWSLLGFVLAASSGLAQNTAPKPEPDNEEVLTAEERPSFTSGVEIVTVPVTVTGPDDQYVSGLEKSDFHIFDNDVEQKIDSFEVAFLPISMVVLVQSSARVEGLLPRFCLPIWCSASSDRQP
jgi:hypothetical protein